MRGKDDMIEIDEAYSRITPAYAGKSGGRFLSHRHVRDHPRLCGEKDYHRDQSYTYTGSPPPMRGKGSALMQSKATAGITPAYAGKRRRRL